MPDAVFTVFCPNSGHRVIVGCACEDAGHNPGVAGYHHDRCQMNSLTANLPCTGPGGCCGEACAGGADCETVANSCQGGHGDCPVPGSCPVHEGYKAHYNAMHAAFAGHDGGERHAFEDLAQPPESCPGGHCHAGIPECKVHHPVVITAGLGSAHLRPVTS